MASAEGCDIANLHIDATEGGQNSCWCQFGSNDYPDFDDDWMACFLSAAPTPLPTLSPIPTASPAPTVEGICKTEGLTTYEGNTVHCIEADGRLYDIFPIENGITTCGANDDNSCPDGTDIWVPRTYDHAKAVWDEYGGDSWGYYGDSDSYIDIVGIYRPAEGCGSCASYAMNSDAMATYEAAADGNVGWTSVAHDADPWFMRAIAYSQPSGDYTAYCWLGAKTWTDDVGWAINGLDCNYCYTFYLCSTNIAVATHPKKL